MTFKLKDKILYNKYQGSICRVDMSEEPPYYLIDFGIYTPSAPPFGWSPTKRMSKNLSIFEEHTYYWCTGRQIKYATTKRGNRLV